MPEFFSARAPCHGAGARLAHFWPTLSARELRNERIEGPRGRGAEGQERPEAEFVTVGDALAT
jgi:hypothetical protein